MEVTVTDVNDNSPEFDQLQYEFNLREHSPVGEALPIVTASDRDIGSNAQLTYSISTGAGQFVVNSETGVPHGQKCLAEHDCIYCIPFVRKYHGGLS